MPGPGEKVGRYALVRELGRGGSGIVFEAIDAALDRSVALKWMHASHSGDAAMAERFLRGARSAARVIHPAAVRILDMGVWDEHLFVVMELLEGQTLDVQMASRRHTIGEVLTQLYPPMLAVHAAHGLGIVHRDIKPNNLFAVVEGSRWVETKVLDFGAAKLIERAEAGDVNTLTGAIVGTPLYMSPEQLSDSTAGPLADVYAFGLVCYEAIAGVLPFPTGGSLFDLVGVKRKPLHGLRVDMPTVPVELEAVIARALSVDPNHRYADMLEFVDALRPFAQVEEKALVRRAASTVPTTQRGLTHTLLPGLEGGGAVTRLANSFFGGQGDRVSALRDTIHLNNELLTTEYREAASLVRSTHALWLACVAATFVIMSAIVLLVAFGHYETAVATALADALVAFLSRVFQRREDHYRSLSESKRAHLEYAQEWAITLQSIDASHDDAGKELLLKRLNEMLIDRMARKRSALP